MTREELIYLGAVQIFTAFESNPPKVAGEYKHIWKGKNKIGHVDIQWLYDVRPSWFDNMESITPIEKI